MLPPWIATPHERLAMTDLLGGDCRGAGPFSVLWGGSWMLMGCAVGWSGGFEVVGQEEVADFFADLVEGAELGDELGGAAAAEAGEG